VYDGEKIGDVLFGALTHHHISESERCSPWSTFGWFWEEGCGCSPCSKYASSYRWLSDVLSEL